jgi:uncharacterized protein (TIGR03435 family)
MGRRCRTLVLPIVLLLPRAFGQDARSSPANGAGNRAAPPAFEVASVRPSDPASRISIRRSGDRLNTSNTSLEFLITWAYDIRNDRLFGKPKWLDSVHYDIAAKAGESLAPGLLQRIMQSLLATRFQLAIHRETRELPMYALVVGKDGAKVHLTEARGDPGQNPFNMTNRGRLTGSQVTAAMLANVLSNQLGRSVQDQTGLQGVFDFELEWEPDTDAQSTNVDGASEPSIGARTGPSIFTAIQEQLGFKLEPRRGPVEVIVIDHIESTPTEN